MSAFDSILAKGAQVKYPKPSQEGQWSSFSGDFGLSAEDIKKSKVSPKEFLPNLQALLPANVDAREYLKNRCSTVIGDIDGTGEPGDPKMMNDLYATVQIDGHIIAELYNGGVCVTTDWFPPGTPDEVRGNFVGIPLSLDAIGPQLAQKRANQIAEAVGGEIVYAKTAQTQNVWGEQPTWYDSSKTNKQAWEEILAGYFNQHTAGTLLEAQLVGQDNEAGAESEKAA
jgi:hypothetical protein